MITVTQIRNGERYFTKHLTANDYYSEGESVTGYWQGEGAARLELFGEVTADQIDALRRNRHPQTGEKLTERSPKVVYHDIVVSAPKAFSIAAMVGEDERLLVAFKESVEVTFGKLEELAAVRDRRGARVMREDYRITGNAVCATFIHDTSRLLDPQVHAHLVFANMSLSEDGRWLALQPRQMMEATKTSLRQKFFRDLGRRVQALGYEVEWRAEGFGIVGISSELEQIFSRRSLQRKEFEGRYQSLFGRAPSKGRIEHFIKEGKGAATSRFRSEFEHEFGRLPTRSEENAFVQDFRSSSMKSSSRDEVREYQRSLVGESGLNALRKVVETACRSLAVTTDGPEMSVSPLVEAAENTCAGNQFAPLISPLGGEDCEIKNGVAETRESFAERTPNRVALGRAAAIRRIKRGQDLSKAMKGYPMGVIAKQVRRSAAKYR